MLVTKSPVSVGPGYPPPPVLRKSNLTTSSLSSRAAVAVQLFGAKSARRCSCAVIAIVLAAAPNYLFRLSPAEAQFLSLNYIAYLQICLKWTHHQLPTPEHERKWRRRLNQTAQPLTNPLGRLLPRNRAIRHSYRHPSKLPSCSPTPSFWPSVPYSPSSLRLSATPLTMPSSTPTRKTRRFRPHTLPARAISSTSCL